MTSRKLSNQDFVAAAKKLQRDGELEIDDGAKVSRNDSHGNSDGAYVAAWVWVENCDAREARRERSARAQ